MNWSKNYEIGTQKTSLSLLDYKNHQFYYTLHVFFCEVLVHLFALGVQYGKITITVSSLLSSRQVYFVLLLFLLGVRGMCLGFKCSQNQGRLFILKPELIKSFFLQPFHFISLSFSLFFLALFLTDFYKVATIILFLFIIEVQLCYINFRYTT